jgi:hypothetical protein
MCLSLIKYLFNKQHMLGQFIFADLLLKKGVAKKNVFFVISILQIILYVLLMAFFYRVFRSWISIAAMALLICFYFVRVHYLKKHLGL